MSAAQRLAEALGAHDFGYGDREYPTAESIFMRSPGLEAAIDLGLALQVLPLPETLFLQVNPDGVASGHFGTTGEYVVAGTLTDLARALTEQLASQTGDQT